MDERPWRVRLNWRGISLWIIPSYWSINKIWQLHWRNRYGWHKGGREVMKRELLLRPIWWTFDVHMYRQSIRWSSWRMIYGCSLLLLRRKVPQMGSIWMMCCWWWQWHGIRDEFNRKLYMGMGRWEEVGRRICLTRTQYKKDKNVYCYWIFVRRRRRRGWCWDDIVIKLLGMVNFTSKGVLLWMLMTMMVMMDIWWIDEWSGRRREVYFWEYNAKKTGPLCRY